MQKLLLLIASLTLSVGMWAKAQHEYVNLGLPSGTKWATMNVGADSVEGVGAFFAFGDTEPDYIVPGQTEGYSHSFDWSNYKWCANDPDAGDVRRQMLKYCNEDYGYKGFADSLQILLPEDDAATQHWGAEWRTPTMKQYIELENNATFEMVTQNGVYGLRATSRVPGYEDKSIFFPCVGVRDSGYWRLAGEEKGGYYLTSSVASGMTHMNMYFVIPDNVYNVQWYRYMGANVRPVYVEENPSPTAIDLGLSSLWAASDMDAIFFGAPGGHLQWGENEYTGKSDTWETYPYGTENQLTKYNTHPAFGDVDGKVVLDADDDPATHQFGSDWHMPDTTDWRELYEQCTWEWAKLDDWEGFMVTSKVPGYEKASIFLPSNGYKEDIYIVQDPENSFYYWTGHLDETNPNQAQAVYFSDKDEMSVIAMPRFRGCSCRPVKIKPSTALEKVRRAQGTMPGARRVMKEGCIVIIRGGERYTIEGLRIED